MSKFVLVLCTAMLVSLVLGGEKKVEKKGDASTGKDTKDLERDETSRFGRPVTYGIERWGPNTKGWPTGGYGGSYSAGGYGGARQDYRDYGGWNNDYANRKGWSTGAYPPGSRPGWSNYYDQNRYWPNYGDEWRRNRGTGIGGWQQGGYNPSAYNYMGPYGGNRAWRGDRGYAFKGAGYGNYGSYGAGIYGNQVYGGDYYWGNQQKAGWGSYGGGGWDPRRYGRGYGADQVGFQNQYGNQWGQNRQGNYKGSSGFANGEYANYWQKGPSGGYGTNKGFQGRSW